MHQSAADHCSDLPPPFFSEYFPDGLNLLLVGANEATQTIIQTYLPQPYYKISVCGSVACALALLQDKTHNSCDMVLSDVGLKGENVYNFIGEVQQLSSSITLVAICESDNETVHAYLSGASMVLWKPMSDRGKEIKNLWRHVYRMKEQREAPETHLSNNSDTRREQYYVSETHLSNDSDMRREQHEVSETHFVNVDQGDHIQQNQNQNEGYSFLPSFVHHNGEYPHKKRRISWDGPLQDGFVYAVNSLGGPEKAVPKRILEIMKTRVKVPEDLTRENVGSHLQKHRLREGRKKRASFSYNHRPHAQPQLQTPIQPSEQNFNNFGNVVTRSTYHEYLRKINALNTLGYWIQHQRLRSMLQQQQIDTSFRSPLITQNQNHPALGFFPHLTVRGANNDGIQAMDTSFGGSNQNQALGMRERYDMLQNPQVAPNPTSNMQQLDQNLTSGTQQLDQ